MQSSIIDSRINKLIKGKGFDIHKLIEKLPRPKKGWTLPGHRYTGPFNPLQDQLDKEGNPLPGNEPFNQVDATALTHDINYQKCDETYSNPKDILKCKHSADRTMLKTLKEISPKNLRERIDRLFVRGVIGAKHKLGLGTRRRKKKRT